MIGDYIAFLSGFRFFIINFAENIRIKLIFNSNYYNKNQKMKKFFSYFMISLCLLGTSVVTSCSSDDDDKEEGLPELPYLSEAAIYQIDDLKDDISFIELTTAGNYFIQYIDMAPESSVSKKNFQGGNFTKKSDGIYQLNGLDKDLKIESAGGKYNITLGDKTYTATKMGSTASFSHSNDICRSWKVKKATANINGPDLINPIEINASNYKDLKKKLEENNRVKPEGFIDIDYISFSNTYKYADHLSYVVKTDETISRGEWQWKANKEGGMINFNDAKDINTYEELQFMSVLFEGTTMIISYEAANGSTTTKLTYELTPALVKI